MVNQEKLLKEIKSLSDSIRQKNRALKMGLSEREEFLESTFKPITKPIKQLTASLAKPRFEGDVLLPISKYEAEQIKTEYPKGQSEESFTGQTSETEFTEEETGQEEMQRKSASEIDIPEEEQSTSDPNLSRIGTDIVLQGSIGRKYLLRMLYDTKNKPASHVYGARVDGHDVKIGDSILNVTPNNDIQVGNKTYKGTKGLFELIFKNKPSKYTKKDLSTFKEILEDTNAHKKNYSKDSNIHRTRAVKYTNIISQLFPSSRIRHPVKRKSVSAIDLNILPKRKKTAESGSSGKGLMKNLYNTNVIYYNDINKLVDRMRLLHEAMEAGHTGLNNEWVALVDELRNRGIII